MRTRLLEITALNLRLQVAAFGLREAGIDALLARQSEVLPPEPAPELPQSLQGTHLREPSRSMTDAS